MDIMCSFVHIAVFLLFAVVNSQNTFTQPIIWQDLADIDVIRVNETFYYSASNMHFSPSAPLLRSWDLVNWEFFAHSLPTLDKDYPKFNLEGTSAYNQGVYASSIAYNSHKGLYYWVGCLVGTDKTYIYTARDPQGPWEEASVISDYCYYDDGILIDDDGAMYVAYGKWVPNGADAKIWVARLTDDLQHDVAEEVFQSDEEIQYIEGARFYKINGTYYIWLVNHHSEFGQGQIVLKSSGGPFGPYDSWRRVLGSSGNPIPGAGSPLQGGIVDTPNGDWWYIAFVDMWPAGRYPVLAPITWDDDGWPSVVFDGENNWGSNYPYPLVKHETKPLARKDDFSELGSQYEWNHNPDNSKWSLEEGLKLQTATVTDDFFLARNTLTHRILGPNSTLTIELDFSSMKDGDMAGLAVFRYNADLISVTKEENGTSLQMIHNIAMDATDGWHTVEKGEVVASKPLYGSRTWLRAQAINAGNQVVATFSYSTDGIDFLPFGDTHHSLNGAVYFLGTRYGVFNYATNEFGGSVTIKSLEITQGE